MLALVLGMGVAALAAVVAGGGSGSILNKTPWSGDESPSPALVPLRDPAVAAELTALRAQIRELTERLGQLEVGAAAKRVRTGEQDLGGGTKRDAPAAGAQPLADRVAALEAALARGGASVTIVPESAPPEAVLMRLDQLNHWWVDVGAVSSGPFRPEGVAFSSEKLVLLARLLARGGATEPAPRVLATYVYLAMSEARFDLALAAIDRHASASGLAVWQTARVRAAIAGTAGDHAQTIAALTDACGDPGAPEIERANSRDQLASAQFSADREVDARRTLEEQWTVLRASGEDGLRALGLGAAFRLGDHDLARGRFGEARRWFENVRASLPVSTALQVQFSRHAIEGKLREVSEGESKAAREGGVR